MKVSISPSLPIRRLEEAEELPRESLVLLEETIARHVFLDLRKKIVHFLNVMMCSQGWAAC